MRTKSILFFLFIVMNCSAQMKEYYHRPRISGTVDIPAGIGSQQTVFIADTTLGGMWFRTTISIPFGTPLRYAIAQGGLIPITGSVTGSDPGDYHAVWQNEVITDEQKNFNVSFTLQASAVVEYNGSRLRSSQWSGIGTSTLLILLDTRLYDYITIIH